MTRGEPFVGDTQLLAELETEIGLLLRRIRRVLQERARLVHPDLQPGGYSMLVHLGQHGPSRAADLCETFAVDKGAVSRQVQQLLDLGLLERTKDPTDGRASLLSLTEKARTALADVVAVRRQRLSTLLGEWSHDELRDFVAGLTRYNEMLG